MSEFIEISSLEDPRLAPYRNLRYSTTARDEGMFIAEGRWLAVRLLQSGLPLHSVLVERRRRNDVTDYLRDNVPVYVIDDKAAPEVIGFNFHRGVLACGYRPQPLQLKDLDFPSRSVVVLGCRLQDPENLGLILRNCAAFGVDAMILGPSCVDPFSRRVLRVSMGNAFFTPIVVADRLETAIGELQKRGFDVAATVLEERAEQLQQAVRAPRQALVFGEEAHGITDSCVTACNRKITLPMKKQTDSLNVAVACGVFLYHMCH